MELSRKPPPDDAGPHQLNPAGGTWMFILAAALAAFYIASSMYIASRRLLWFDELLTVRFSQLPNAVTIWKAITHVDSNMPYPYFLVVHAFWKLPGPAEIIARLPSALGVAGGLLIIFDCTRRLTDGLHGLIAVAFLTCSFLPEFGYEARSYGLYFLMAALSLWVWIHTSNTRKSSAAIFAAVFVAGVMMNYYFVLCLVPYAAWELSVWRPWRPPSAKLIGGAFGIVCAAALLSPQILAARVNSADYWAKPSFRALREVFSSMLPGGLFLLCLIMVWAALTARDSAASATPMRDAPMRNAERVGWLFLLIPIAGYIVATAVTNAFVTRYFINTLPGVSAAFACWLWRGFRGTRYFAVGVFLLLTIFGMAKQAETARHPQSIDPFRQQTQTRQMMDREKSLRQDGKQFILVHSTLLYMEARYYTKHPEQYGFLIDSDEERSHMTVRTTLAMEQFYPSRIWTLEDLKTHALESAVVEPLESTLTVMKEAGFRPVTRFADPPEVFYFEQEVVEKRATVPGKSLSE